MQHPRVQDGAIGELRRRWPRGRPVHARRAGGRAWCAAAGVLSVRRAPWQPIRRRRRWPAPSRRAGRAPRPGSGPGSGRSAPARPSVRLPLRPAMSSSRRGSVASGAELVQAGQRRGRPRPRRWRTAAGRPGMRAASARSTGRVEVDGEAVTAGELRDADAGALLEPARQRIVGGERRQVAQDRRAAHGDDVRAVAVVGQGVGGAARGRVDQPPGVAEGQQRDGAGAQEHEASPRGRGAPP